MKRIAIFALFVSLLLLSAGCKIEDNSQPTNSVFTDAFFSNVVEISDSSYGTVSGERMAAVITYLKNLKLIPTNEQLAATDDDGNQIYGLDVITFRMSDGSEITFIRNHTMLTSSDQTSYVVEKENLYIGLKEAFEHDGN